MIKKLEAVLILMMGLFPMYMFSQDKFPISAEDIAKLAVENHYQIKISSKNIDIARQQKEIVKLQKLPNIVASTSQFYLGNVLVIDKDFSNKITSPMPHYGSSYGVQATQLIFKGGLVNKSIEMAGLREQLSALDLEKNKQDVKFLVISNYLDIYKIINQETVFANNKKLALERLKNVQKFYQEGMITRNEVIRAELAIKNLDQGILTLANNRKIINYNLVTVLGLDANTEIIPTENLKNNKADADAEFYLNLAHQGNPQLQSAQTNIDVADKNIEIIKTDRMPTLSGFGGYSLQRPITSKSPVLDMYSSGWQAGVSLSYNIDNLYKTKEKIKLGEIQKNQAQDALVYTSQNVDMSVNAAYIKYQESMQQAEILDASRKLANENYNITEAKYMNQLAVQAEMIDAQNQKLQSELDYANAEINVLYQYYNVLKSTGTL